MSSTARRTTRVPETLRLKRWSAQTASVFDSEGNRGRSCQPGAEGSTCRVRRMEASL
jgi:hypothetical protein